MKKQFLFPHKCKWVGFAILALGILMFFPKESFLDKLLTFDVSKNPYFVWLFSENYNGILSETNIDFTYTLQILLIVAGGLLVMFSKEKFEDEFTMSMRLKSLMLSVLINYIIVLITDILLYGELFLYIMTFGFYTIIILYVIIFHILLCKNSKKEVENAE
ncbi:MAG: hypothetical protein LBB41_06255 [Prevotellaceae bacterium]|jgi:hypothetical protein|nr:hypothetical protein [Prevotellaceae bacterium]